MLNAQIVVCENKIGGKKYVEAAVVHELVHAYDSCRAKIDWTNCNHHACSEVCVRARIRVLNGIRFARQCCQPNASTHAKQCEDDRTRWCIISLYVCMRVRLCAERSRNA